NYPPGAALDTRRAADLAVKSDLIGIVAAAVFAVIVVGFASDRLLSSSKRRNNEKCKSQSEEAEKRFDGHELAPRKIAPRQPQIGQSDRKRRGRRKKPSTR